MMRRSLEQWFESQNIRPDIVGEFEDSALLNVFGLRGAGLFPAASVISGELEEQYKVRFVGVVSGVQEWLYAITVDRRIKHPTIAAICEAAETWFKPVQGRNQRTASNRK